MKQKAVTFIPGISRVISNITPILILFVFTKFEDATEIGALNYFISLIVLIGIFTDFGLTESIQRFLSHYDSKKLIFPTIALEFILTIVGGLIFVAADLISKGQLSYNHTLVLFFILIFSASNVIILVFNGLQDNLRTSQYFLGAAILFILTTFILYFTGTNAVDSFLYGRLVSWIVFTFLPILDLYKKQFFEFSIKLPKRFVTFAVNNFMIIFSYSVYNQWDSILITKTLGEYQNGIYKPIALLASAPYVISVALNTKLLPEYSKLHKEDKIKEIRKSFLYFTKLLFAGSTILVLISIPLAKLGLSIVYNNEIAENGYFYFSPILLAILIYVCAIPAVSMLQAIGREHVIRNAALIQSIGFVVLSTLLLPQFGLIILPLILIGINIIFFAVNFVNAFKVK